MGKWFAIIAVLLMGLCSVPNLAASSELKDQRLLKIQVAYLHNFTKFIQWPTEENEKDLFVIGVYGHNPFNGLLIDLQGKTVQEQRVEIRILTSIQQTDDCQLLFIGEGVNQATLQVLMDYLGGKSVLTVSAQPGFVRRGGMIELQQQGEYVLFAVNLDRAEQSGLSIPSQVLALAVEVLQVTR